MDAVSGRSVAGCHEPGNLPPDAIRRAAQYSIGRLGTRWRVSRERGQRVWLQAQRLRLRSGTRKVIWLRPSVAP